MRYEKETRELLIANAIRSIAEGGFENATTKNLAYSGGQPADDFRMNEVYIYRLFGGKDKLFAHVFQRLDKELFSAIHAGAPEDGFETDTKEKLHKVFMSAWTFITGNEERCRCYVRYYYSVYFNGESQKAHAELFEKMTERLRPIFIDEADVTEILHSVFSAIFDFAIRYYNGELENNENNRVHIFNVLYRMLSAYLKEEQ